VEGQINRLKLAEAAGLLDQQELTGKKPEEVYPEDY
jgi:hypothetical protein